MENASKGLLIAAGVLIAVILITFGIKILSPATGVVENSEEIGSTISSSSSDAVDMIQTSIGGSKWTQNGTVVKKGSLTLEVGDYINYNAIGSGYTGDWRILGVENGQLLILADEKTENVQLSKDNGYDLEKLHNYCAKYGKGNGAVSARAIKVEDIDRVTGYDPSQFKGYGNEKTYTLTDGTSTTLKTTYYFYYISDYLAQGTKAYDMLCGIKNYELASISIDAESSSYGSFSLRAVYDRYISGSVLYRTDGYATWNNANTRAVVYLEEDIKLQKDGDTWEII